MFQEDIPYISCCFGPDAVVDAEANYAWGKMALTMTLSHVCVQAVLFSFAILAAGLMRAAVRTTMIGCKHMQLGLPHGHTRSGRPYRRTSGPQIRSRRSPPRISSTAISTPVMRSETLVSWSRFAAHESSGRESDHAEPSLGGAAR